MHHLQSLANFLTRHSSIHINKHSFHASFHHLYSFIYTRYFFLKHIASYIYMYPPPHNLFLYPYLPLSLSSSCYVLYTLLSCLSTFRVCPAHQNPLRYVATSLSIITWTYQFMLYYSFPQDLHSN